MGNALTGENVSILAIQSPHQACREIVEKYFH